MFEQLKQNVINEIPVNIWNALITFIAVLLAGLLLKYFLQILGKRIFEKTKNQLDNRLLDVVLPRLRSLTIVVAIYLSLKEITKELTNTDKIGNQLLSYAEGILFVAFIFLLTMLLTRILDTALKHFIKQHATHAADSLNKTLLPLLNKIIIIIVVFIAALITLGHFGVDVSGLLVFLGGGSVAIALAAQETLSNMIAGFIIMIDRPFRVGDRIKLPSGEIGDVYEIGLRSTSILDFDNNLIVTPNTELTKSKVVNYSYPEKEIRALVDVNIAYGTPLELAKEIMTQQALLNSDVLKNPPPIVFFSSMKESTCVLSLICRVDDWQKKGPVEHSLRENIYNEFLKSGIKPSHTIHIVKTLKEDNNDSKSN